MSATFDYLDLRAIDCLGIQSPRNLANVARKLGVPTETLRKRLNRLRPQIFLYANIYHTNLGLKKAVLFAEAIPGYEDLLYDCLKTNYFWIYVNRCYGMNEGCLAVYTIPKEHVTDFEQFVCQLERLGVATNVQLYWTTCFQGVYSKSNWFNEETKKWDFHWDKWIEEIPNMGTQLPYTLIDPEDFPVLGDEIDVFILKEFEKNPAIKLTELAKMLGVSHQVVEYHYRKHVMERGLIEGFWALAFHFDRAVSDMFLFIFKFHDLEKMAKFALSLIDKPFVGGLGKILEENALIAYLFLPRSEFRTFVDILSNLIRLGLLQSYMYVIQDLRKVQRQTISYEYFKNSTWIYDHKKHVQDLKDLVESEKCKR